MYKITVKGEAKTDYPNLKELNGIDCQDDFTEYFDDEFTFKDSVTSGYMDFRYENGKLFTYTNYTSDRKLTDVELEELLDYTTGQWSDGIGEGFGQEPCYEGTISYQKYDSNYDDYQDQDEADEDLDVFISPWYPGQVATIEQTEI